MHNNYKIPSWTEAKPYRPSSTFNWSPHWPEHPSSASAQRSRLQRVIAPLKSDQNIAIKLTLHSPSAVHRCPPFTREPPPLNCLLIPRVRSVFPRCPARWSRVCLTVLNSEALLKSMTQGKLRLINELNGSRDWIVSAMLPLVRQNIYIQF